MVKASKKHKLHQHMVKTALQAYERALVEGRGWLEFASFPLKVRLDAITMRAAKSESSKKQKTQFLGFIASMEADLKAVEDAGDKELAARIRQTIVSYRKLNKQAL